MPIDLPPQVELYTPSHPAIIRVGEVWKTSLDGALAQRGFNRKTRRALLSTIERLAKGSAVNLRNELPELSRWAGGDVGMALRDPALAMPLISTFGAASARGFRAQGAGTPDASITWKAAQEIGTTSLTPSASMSTGTGTRDVLILLAIQAAAGVGPPTTLLVGAQACTLISSNSAVPSENVFAYITSAQISGADSQTIAPTWSSGTFFSCHAATFEVKDLQSRTPTQEIADTTDPLSMTITVQAGGFLVMIAACANSTAFGAPTGVADNFDVYASSNFNSAGGAQAYSTLQSGIIVAAAPGGSKTRPIMRALAMR